MQIGNYVLREKVLCIKSSNTMILIAIVMKVTEINFVLLVSFVLTFIPVEKESYLLIRRH